MKRVLLTITISTLLGSCTTLDENSNIRPIPLRGGFQVKLRSEAFYIKGRHEYPIAANTVESIPYFNITIPSGSGLIGMYKNSGMRCQIIWTGIISPNIQPISNSFGVAKSDCSAWYKLETGEIINAYWN
jgi:hypothetical protein